MTDGVRCSCPLLREPSARLNRPPLPHTTTVGAQRRTWLLHCHCPADGAVHDGHARKCSIACELRRMNSWVDFGGS